MKRLRARGPLLVGDVALLGVSLYLGFGLRFLEVGIPADWLDLLRFYVAVSLGVKLPVFAAFKLYRMSWAYVSFPELTRVFLAVSLSSSLLGTVFFLLERAELLPALPASVLLMDYAFTLLFVGGFRSAKRIYLGLRRKRPLQGRRVLLMGAGNAGEQVLREMLHHPDARYVPIGFVDDDPHKRGTTIHGVPVLGRRRDLPQLVRANKIEELLICMPSAPAGAVRQTVALGRQAGLTRIRILPSLQELISGRVGLADVREVQLEDLLGREPVRINPLQIERYLRDKVVLITGAAGSIGGELCRQVPKFKPRRLVALDQDETGLFELERALAGQGPPVPLSTVIADIQDAAKVERVFSQTRPQVVFHAAAYKHVALLEAHPDEAVKNNVVGTAVLARAALRARVERFVLISTDKAVNPTSVMGATKRAAEVLVQSLNGRGPTRFSAVRFGNVLGSRGSVVPIFQEQIRRGGPVTVTHRDMKRFFMVPAEAALLVLQAGAIGQGGEVFVLDMGRPVKVVELARALIRLSGHEPDRDIPLVFSGIRPGEKLFEELLTAEEGTQATHHEKIYVARLATPAPFERLQEGLARLQALVGEGAPRAEVLRALRALVPSYTPAPRVEKRPAEAYPDDLNLAETGGST